MGWATRWQLRWLEPALLLSRILFAMAALYGVVGGVLDVHSVRAATWMAMVPFAGGLGIMVFTMGFGVTMAKAHNPERYAQRVRPSSIPARYRVNFFATSYDRRDLHLEHYVPGYRRSMRLASRFSPSWRSSPISSPPAVVGSTRRSPALPPCSQQWQWRSR